MALDNKGLTFLLADDDSDDKTLFCEALSEIDPTIVCQTASDGSEALTILSQKRIKEPSIIFLDINMPVMDGWQCLRKLKEHPDHRNIPVIMYSTSSYQRDIELALENGLSVFSRNRRTIASFELSYDLLQQHP